MSDEKMKVSDLPEQEQKELIAEAYSLGATGVFTGWKVSTLKNKIEELKAQKNGEGAKDEEAKDEGANDEQNAPKDEQNASNDEQNGADDEQNAPKDEQNAPKDEGANETGETIVAGDGGTFDENGEENKPEAEKEGEGEENKPEAETKEQKKEEPKKQPKEKKEPRFDGICHICRSKVLDGVCTGCGFHK